MTMQEPVLHTERLTLRLARESDVPAILRHFRENEGHFAPTDPPMPPDFLTEAYWLKRIATNREEFEGDRSARFFLFKKADPSRVIGTVSLSNFARGPFQACYLGYGIAASEEGKGHMTEALREVVRYAFEDLGLHRVMANHLPENARSAAVLKKLGFEVEGLAKDYLFINGRWRDHVLNALTNPDWKPGLS